MPQVKLPEESMARAASEGVQLQTVSYLAGYRAETQQAKPLANEKILTDKLSFHPDTDGFFVLRIGSKFDSYRLQRL